MSFLDDSISFSEINTWTGCPLSHKLKYIDKVEKEIAYANKYEWAAPFGEGAHVGVQSIIANETYQEALDKFRYSFITRAMNEYQNPPSMNHNGELLLAGRRILKDTKNTFITEFPNYELIANEHMLNEPAFPDDPRWKKYRFKGYIDTIIKTQDDDICLIDQKTCGWGWDARKKNDKMKIYQLAYYKHYYAQETGIDLDKIRTFFMLLKRKPGKNNAVEIFEVSCTKKRIENALSLERKALINMEKGFAPPLGKTKFREEPCFFCVFKHTKFCK